MEKIELKQPVFLCGMMGSGKSTIGKELANILDVPFCDLDTMIIEEAGMSIPQIFEEKGEEWFRNLEKNIVLRESQTFTGIMALGGGSLQSQKIVDKIKLYGLLIFLKVPEAVILKRIAGDSNRPKLKSSEVDINQLEERILTLIEQRLPFYNQAQIIIEAGKKSQKEIAESILNKIKGYEALY